MYTYSIIDDVACYEVTTAWQKAIDEWSERRVWLLNNGHNPDEMRIEIYRGKDNVKEEDLVRTVDNILHIEEHSNFLLYMEQSEDNRVTKRIVQSEYEMPHDGMVFDDHGFYTTAALFPASDACVKTCDDDLTSYESYDDFMRRMYREADDSMTLAAMETPLEECDTMSIDEMFAWAEANPFDEGGEYGENNGPVDFHGDFENMTAEQQDAIINPKHYKMIPAEAYVKHPEGLEYMDLMEYILAHHNGVESHLLGQVFKYAMRLGKKDSDLQDAKKIAWYADRLVSVIKER